MHIQLDAQNSYLRTLPTGNFEFSPTVFQPAHTLTPEQMAEFRVFPLVDAPQPEYDPITQRVIGLGPALIDGTWTQQWAVETLTAEEIAANTGALRNSLTAQVTSLRWQHETGGITLPGGIQIATGTDDQNRITTVIANAQLAGVTAVDFKSASGWVTLTLEQVQGIAAAIALHVQACFSAERAHHEAIDALASIEALQAYDVTAGWPATDSQG